MRVACLIVLALLYASPAFAADTGLTADDISGIILKVVAGIATVFGSVVLAEFNRFVKDKGARDSALATMRYLSPLVLNATAGLLKDHPVPANKVPAVVASMIRLAKNADPEAFKRLGFDDVGLAKLAIAHLPGVDGEISDDDIATMAAASKMPAAGTAKPATLDQVGAALGPLVESLVEAALKKQGLKAPA